VIAAALNKLAASIAPGWMRTSTFATNVFAANVFDAKVFEDERADKS